MRRAGPGPAEGSRRAGAGRFSSAGPAPPSPLRPFFSGGCCQRAAGPGGRGAGSAPSPPGSLPAGGPAPSLVSGGPSARSGGVAVPAGGRQSFAAEPL